MSVESETFAFHYGKRVERNHEYAVVNCDLDILHSWLGMCRTRHFPEPQTKTTRWIPEILAVLRFVMSEVAVLEEDEVMYTEVTQSRINDKDINKFELHLDALKQLNGHGMQWVEGLTQKSASLNYARALCRKCQSSFAGIRNKKPNGERISRLLDVLSDMLYEMGKAEERRI